MGWMAKVSQVIPVRKLDAGGRREADAGKPQLTVVNEDVKRTSSGILNVEMQCLPDVQSTRPLQSPQLVRLPPGQEYWASTPRAR